MLALRDLPWSAGETVVEVLREGTFFTHIASGPNGEVGRQVTFTAADLHKMVEVYAQAQAEGMFPGGGGKVDVNHALEFGAMDPASTAARGRALRLEVGPHIDIDSGVADGTLGLYAVTAWTPGGVEEIEGGKFAGVSAELIHPDFALSKKTGEKLGGWLFTGYTLCNDPFIPGLADVTAPKLAARSGGTVVTLSTRQRPVASEETRPMKTLLARLGLNDGDTEDAAIRAVESLRQANTELTEQRDSLVAERDELNADRTEALRVVLVEDGHCTPAKLDTAMEVFANAAGSWADRKAFLFNVFPSGNVKNIEPKAAPAGEEPAADEAADLATLIASQHKAALADERERTGRPVSAARSFEILENVEREVFSSKASRQSYLNTPAAEA